MTSEKLKPTPGLWEVAKLTPSRVDTPSGSISISWSSNHDNGARGREAEANARLIAEAGTVHHECGLSPRELLEAARELHASLLETTDALEHLQNAMSLRINPPTLEKARAALAKHKEV